MLTWLGRPANLAGTPEASPPCISFPAASEMGTQSALVSDIFRTNGATSDALRATCAASPASRGLSTMSAVFYRSRPTYEPALRPSVRMEFAGWNKGKPAFLPNLVVSLCRPAACATGLVDALLARLRRDRLYGASPTAPPVEDVSETRGRLSGTAPPGSPAAQRPPRSSGGHCTSGAATAAIRTRYKPGGGDRIA